MKIYKNKNKTEEVEILDFGILPAGETKQYTFWVFNDSMAFLRMLNFAVEHKEVKVIKAPVELMAHTGEELVLEWSPSITLKEGLKARLRISGIELWG
jgi:hypothetical protein